MSDDTLKLSTVQLSLFDPILVPLTRGYVTLIDPADSDLVILRWHVMTDEGRAYAIRRIPDRKDVFELMHRLILARIIGRALEPREFTDHIDGDGLNNRRNNLRVATPADNVHNTKRAKNNTSGYKGVSWHKRMKHWAANIRLNDRAVFLGYFDTPEEAYAAYCEAAKQHYGEFARLE